MIEETDLTPAAVERFWTDVQDGESKTFTLPAGGANYTDVIPNATDGSGGAEALPALVAALVRVTAERDRARDLAARLEEQLAQVRDVHRPHEVPAVYSLEGFTACSCTRGMEYATCPTAAVLDETVGDGA